MTDVFKKVLMIDDDRINNGLNAIVIKNCFKPYSIAITSFTDPQAGVEYIAEHFSIAEEVPTLLFLDINMPELTGWDVLDKIKSLNAAQIQHITIYILSSSIDPADIIRANANPLVKGFISKPLAPHLASIFSETLHAMQEHIVV